MLALRGEVDQIHVAAAVHNYILAMVRSTRQADRAPAPGQAVPEFRRLPRASLALYQAGTGARLAARPGLSRAGSIQEIAPDILRHRVGLTYEAEAEEITADWIVAHILEQTPVPAV